MLQKNSPVSGIFVLIGRILCFKRFVMSLEQKSAKKTATDKIAGLSDIEELEGVSPRDLWYDGGAAFPGY